MEGESGVRQTSILAFRRITPEELRGLQAAVYDVIRRMGPVNDRVGAKLSKHPKTGKPIRLNVYVPRRNELMHNELVRVAYLDKDKHTGNTVKYWEIW